MNKNKDQKKALTIIAVFIGFMFIPYTGIYYVGKIAPKATNTYSAD